MVLSSTRQFVVVRVLALFLTLFFLAACEGPETRPTTLFETAEAHYREGNYREALTAYELFLQEYPQSPLATTAEMRLRNIHREVSSMLERPGSPRPELSQLPAR